MIDSGPNQLSARSQGTTSVSPGHSQEAIGFNGSSSSFFQIAGVTSLGIASRAFSMSFWVRPTVVSGVLVHISSGNNGHGWCIPFVGFSANDSIVGQIYYFPGSRAVFGSQLLQSSSWTHVVKTWSPITGLQIYVDGLLIDAVPSATTYSASGVPNYVTLGNMLSGGGCHSGQISPVVPFNGAMDDLRIYSRVLTPTDIFTLFHI